MNAAFVIPMTVLALVAALEMLCRFLIVLVIVGSLFGLMIVFSSSGDISGDLGDLLRPKTFDLMKELTR